MLSLLFCFLFICFWCSGMGVESVALLFLNSVLGIAAHYQHLFSTRLWKGTNLSVLVLVLWHLIESRLGESSAWWSWFLVCIFSNTHVSLFPCFFVLFYLVLFHVVAIWTRGLNYPTDLLQDLQWIKCFWLSSDHASIHCRQNFDICGQLLWRNWKYSTQMTFPVPCTVFGAISPA